MAASALPATCQTALKEWAGVVQALARGEQTVLIRKGGLLEPGSGFQILSNRVVFYPTFEHQTVKYLRPPYARDMDEALAARPPEGQLRLELCGVIEHATHTLDASVITQLEPFHIYNDAFLTQRLKWQPDQPLVIAVVRAFRLPSPQLVPVVSRYAGCKSWVDLDQPIPLAGAIPVLDDQAFADRLSRIRAILAAG